MAIALGIYRRYDIARRINSIHHSCRRTIVYVGLTNPWNNRRTFCKRSTWERDREYLLDQGFRIVAIFSNHDEAETWQMAG